MSQFPLGTPCSELVVLGELEASMLDACNATDGTASKLFLSLENNARVQTLSEYADFS